jgi:hypothetical protein
MESQSGEEDQPIDEATGPEDSTPLLPDLTQTNLAELATFADEDGALAVAIARILKEFDNPKQVLAAFDSFINGESPES